MSGGSIDDRAGSLGKNALCFNNGGNGRVDELKKKLDVLVDQSPFRIMGGVVTKFGISGLPKLEPVFKQNKGWYRTGAVAAPATLCVGVILSACTEPGNYFF